jgi:hypothetical protein
MWLIGRVNKTKKKFIEELGGRIIENIGSYDLESALGAVKEENQGNDELVIVYIKGDMIQGLEGLNRVGQQNKRNKELNKLHKERLETLEDLWDRRQVEYEFDEDVIMQKNDGWSADGDVYTINFEYIFKGDLYGEVDCSSLVATFKEGTAELASDEFSS